VQNLLSSSLLSKKLMSKIHKTIIFSVILYGFATWSLTFREERRLRVFESRVLGRKFERKRDEVTGEWSGLHNKGLNDLYSTPNIIRVIISRKVAFSFRFRCHNHISMFLLFIGTTWPPSRAPQFRKVNFITKIMFGEEYKLTRSSLHIAIHSLVASSHLGPSIFPNTLFLLKERY